MVTECAGYVAPGDAELAAMEEYIALLVKGGEPPVEKFLKGFPQFARSLRPVLEAAVEVNHRYRRLKVRHPDMDVKRLLGIDSA